MRQLLQLLVILALLAVPGAAGAQDIRINPVPPDVKPRWTQIPGLPQVSWAPNLPTDVFRYRGGYYFFWEGYCYQGPAPEGPWEALAKLPQVFYKVAPAYFKTVKKAGEVPAASEGATPSPKAKIIDIPPTAPAPPEPGSTPPGSPASLPPPKVM